MAGARAIGSLPVANTQELAETYNGSDDQVPERYLVKEASSKELIVSGDGSISAIPIIDFGKLLDPRSSSEECAKLGSACYNWGFFQLINHGVPYEVAGNLMNDVAEFFKQPLEVKKPFSQQHGSLEGYGQAFVVSEEQKLDWGDMLYLQIQPSESRDLRFWPTRPASFGRSVDVYSSEVAKLSCRLLEFMAKSVGAEPASLLGVFGGQPLGMRVIYYYPVLSNGKFTSVEHRAAIHPSKERISVAIFHYPCQDLMMGPLPEFMTKGEKARYGSTSYQDFMTQYFLAKLDGRNLVERLKLE